MRTRRQRGCECQADEIKFLCGNHAKEYAAEDEEYDYHKWARARGITLIGDLPEVDEPPEVDATPRVQLEIVDVRASLCPPTIASLERTSLAHPRVVECADI